MTCFRLCAASTRRVYVIVFSELKNPHAVSKNCFPHQGLRLQKSSKISFATLQEVVFSNEFPRPGAFSAHKLLPEAGRPQRPEIFTIPSFAFDKKNYSLQGHDVLYRVKYR